VDVLNMIKQWCGWMNDRIHGKGGVGVKLYTLTDFGSWASEDSPNGFVVGDRLSGART